jgi:hypothetical protein
MLADITRPGEAGRSAREADNMKSKIPGWLAAAMPAGRTAAHGVVVGNPARLGRTQSMDTRASTAPRS